MLKTYNEMTEQEFDELMEQEENFYNEFSKNSKKCPLCGRNVFSITTEYSYNLIMQENDDKTPAIGIDCKCGLTKYSYSNNPNLTYKQRLEMAKSEWNERA